MNHRMLLLVFGFFLLFIAGAVILQSVQPGKTLDSTTTQQPTPVVSTTQLANPASVNCQKQGGNLVIKTQPNGQYGVCYFEDNMACEEWALYRGQCPKGGVKTTGYDTQAQIYCAWRGGKTLAVPNATCTLPDGTVCGDEAYYNGTCPTQ